MPLDKTAYHNLERLFEAQVDRDKAHAIERIVQGWGVYLPCVEPESWVDYVIVGMEPSFGWANSIEDARKKVQGGFRNFSLFRQESVRQRKRHAVTLPALHRPVPPPTRTDVPHDGCVEGGNAGDGGGP